MLGLRASNSDISKRFLLLYHESIQKTLFSRLKFIIQIQDWEALSDAFWIKQGLDILLATLVEDETITLAPNSAKVPLLVSCTISDSSDVQQQTDIQENSGETSLEFHSLVQNHARFLYNMSKLQVNCSNLVL